MGKFAPEFGQFIAENRFRDCLTVIGILLHTEDAEKLACLASKIFGRKNSAVVDYKKFINSIWREHNMKGLPKWYDIVISKLVASMSVADIDLRVRVALDDCVEAALHVGLRQSSDFIIQKLENCFARYTSPAFPEKITIANFKECIGVIGILLSHREMDEICARVAEKYGDGRFIDFRKFVRSLRDKRFASGGAGAYAKKKYENIAHAVVRMQSAPKKATMKKIGKGLGARYAPKELQDGNERVSKQVKTLREEVNAAEREVNALRGSIDEHRTKAKITRYYTNKVAGALLTCFFGRDSSTGARISWRRATRRPATAKAAAASAKTREKRGRYGRAPPGRCGEAETLSKERRKLRGFAKTPREKGAGGRVQLAHASRGLRRAHGRGVASVRRFRSGWQRGASDGSQKRSIEAPCVASLTSMPWRRLRTLGARFARVD